MEKFLGLCLLRAELKLPVLRKAFSCDPLHYHPVFPATMSGKKFEHILRCFNSFEGTPVNRADRLHKVSLILEKLINNFQANFSPNEALSLDESTYELLWRGRLVFKQYIKNKKYKYGIKFYEPCTPDGYVLNIEIYKGKTDGVANGSKINDLVNRLMKPYLNKGHHLYMDNYYNSIDLSNQLFKQKTHTTGTLRRNRKKNPKSIISFKKMKPGQHVFSKKGPIYVSRWRDKREVYSITTGHLPKMITVNNRYGKQMLKPKHISEYNMNMSGIDRSDQMVSYYSSPRKTIRWYKKVIFIFHLLDISLWNSYFLYKKTLTTSNFRFLDFHEAIVKKLIHLPENVIHGNQLVKNKNICRNIRGRPIPPSSILGHMQEKIPHPPGIINYFLLYSLF